MGIAFLSGKRSKDPRTRVGACIVNEHKRICGTGYNGMPDGCSDDVLSWKRDKKQQYVCHAEMNAILNKNSADVRGCKIYTSLFPCNECAKIIIQAGIKEVVYYSDKKKDDPKYQAAREMFKLAEVECRELKPTGPIIIDFTEMDAEDSSSSGDKAPEADEQNK